MNGSKKTSIGINELDFVTLTCFTALVITGWLMIYTVHYNPVDQFAFFNLSSNPGKQLFFIVLCAVILFFIQITDWTLWRTFALPIYLASLVLLAGTLVLGKEINGNHAWYQFGGFSLQPAELVKFTTCLAMAGYLSSTGVTLRDTKTRLYTLGLFLIPVGIIVLQKDAGSALVFFSFVLVLYREGLPSSWYALGFGTAFMVILGLLFQAQNVVAWLMMVVNFQLLRTYRNTRPWWIAFAVLVPVIIWWPELAGWAYKALSGNALPADATDENSPGPAAWLVMAPPLALLIAAFIPSYFRKNNLIQRRIQLSLLLLTLASGLVFLSGTLYKAMAPHQQQRIRIWLHPAEAAADARGSAYNLLHSKMAIGSGGFMGKGMFEGNMTKLKYVPEQSTDYIFCTIGEEHGFVGVLGVIGLFAVLLYRITQLAERQRSNFSRVYAYSVAGVIFVHFVVNIGMTMGLFPTIGIPLPFISYGGSSLIGFTFMIGVLLKLDSHRNQA